MFGKAIAQARQAQMSHRNNPENPVALKIAWAELLERLEHLEIMVAHIRQYDHIIESTPIDQQGQQTSGMLTMMKILSEAFYHCAWRIVEICEVDIQGDLKTFKPSGVRDVRNQLLMHVSKRANKEKNGLVAPMIACGGTDGPRLTQMLEVKHIDAGLYVNARQYADELVDRFDRMGLTDGGA